MYRHSRLAGIVLGCAASLAIVGCTTNTGVAPVGGMNTMAQVKYAAGIAPHYMVTRDHAHPAISGILFSYNGGPVLVKPHLYLILWGYKTYGDPDHVARLLKDYLGRSGGSKHNNIYTQYYQIVSGQTTYVTNPRGQLMGVWLDQTNAVPQNPTDLQVSNESLAGVAKFGYDAGGSYIVATPHGHNTIGFGTQWCAYHSNAAYSAGPVSYTNLPYMPDAGGNCGAGYTQAPPDELPVDEGVTIVEGHEEGESVSDPVPPTGWYNNSYGEIGDACAWTDIQNEKFGRKTYTMQPMYSNATESCVQTYKK